MCVYFGRLCVCKSRFPSSSKVIQDAEEEKEKYITMFGFSSSNRSTCDYLTRLLLGILTGRVHRETFNKKMRKISTTASLRSTNGLIRISNGSYYQPMKIEYAKLRTTSTHIGCCSVVQMRRLEKRKSEINTDRGHDSAIQVASTGLLLCACLLQRVEIRV